MSAQPYESAAPEGGAVAPPPEAYAGQAQATVDVLPATTGRKQNKPEPTPHDVPAADFQAAPPVDPTWGAPAPVDPAWGSPVAQEPPAQPVEPAVPAQPVETTPPGPLVYAGAIPSPVPVPIFPGGGVPVADPAAEPVQDVQAEAAPSAKRFLGMQLRRPRRGEGAVDGPVEPGPQAPVAAWPTDVGLPVVATAEPAVPTPWGAPVGLDEAVADGHLDVAPVEAAPVDATPADLAPVEAAPVEVAAVDAVPAEPVAVGPIAVEPVAAQPVVEPVAAEPVVVDPQLAVEAGFAVEPSFAVEAVTPVPAPAADDELRTLRTSLEASDARRVAAEHRADNAVAYAQQLQAELTEVRAELEAKLQAAEVRIRTVANESQDWQIRHREAQAQIAELANSLSGAEQRLAEVRTERDELMVQLEEATAPVSDDVAAELDA
jgi:nicotinate-nucleotide--dimethylbenzimidazole phosphoribosyltransferase